MFFYNDLGTITTGQESVDMEVEDMLCQNSVDNEELMAQMDEIINLHIPSLLFRMTVLGKAHDFSKVKNILKEYDNKIATVNSIIEGFDVVIEKMKNFCNYRDYRNYYDNYPEIIKSDPRIIIFLREYSSYVEASNKDYLSYLKVNGITIFLKDYMENLNKYREEFNHLKSNIDFCITEVPKAIEGLNSFLKECKKASNDFFTENNNTSDIIKCIDKFAKIRSGVDEIIDGLSKEVNHSKSVFFIKEHCLNGMLIELIRSKPLNNFFNKFDEKFSLEKEEQQKCIHHSIHRALTMSYEEHLKVDDIYIKLKNSLASLSSELITVPYYLLPDEAVRLTSQIEIANNFSSFYKLRSRVDDSEFYKINNILEKYDSKMAEVQKFIANLNKLIESALGYYGFNSEISEEIRKKSKIITDLQEHIEDKTRYFNKVKYRIAYNIEELNKDFRKLACQRDKNYIYKKYQLIIDDTDELKGKFIRMTSLLKDNIIDKSIDELNDGIIKGKDNIKSFYALCKSCAQSSEITDVLKYIKKMKVLFMFGEVREIYGELICFVNSQEEFNDISNTEEILFQNKNSCGEEAKSYEITSPLPSTEPNSVVNGELTDKVRSFALDNNQDNTVVSVDSNKM